MTLNTENRLMQGIAVAILAEDREQSVIINSRVESTHMAHTVLSHTGFPHGPSDAVLRQLRTSAPKLCWWISTPEMHSAPSAQSN